MRISPNRHDGWFGLSVLFPIKSDQKDNSAANVLIANMLNMWSVARSLYLVPQDMHPFAHKVYNLCEEKRMGVWHRIARG